ncbi:MAG: hypothetical protein K6F83_07995 [Clostridiales bacterium]|nr:hypothetical protein [Clostridiales bacterium]
MDIKGKERFKRIVSLALTGMMMASFAGCSTEIKLGGVDDTATTAEEKTAVTEEKENRETGEQTQKDNTEDYVLAFEDSGDGYILGTDEASYEITPSENEGKILITINGNSNELDISYTDWLGVSIVSPYLVVHNGKTYIYAVGGLEGDGREINVYEVKDDTAKRIDFIPYTGIMSMENTTEFTCYKYGFMNGMISATMIYTVGDDGIPVPVTGEYILTSYCDLCLKEPASGYIVRDGEVTTEEKTISSGAIVVPVLTDGKTFVDISDEQGDVVRIECSEIFSDSLEGMYTAVTQLFDLVDY